jgi:hypothetical protein
MLKVKIIMTKINENEDNYKRNFIFAFYSFKEQTKNIDS